MSDAHAVRAGELPVAHQFDDPAQQRSAVTLGMWLFLVTEIMFFGGLFLVYTVYRWQYPTAFAAASHHLDVLLGGINTAVLICSSLTMALAVDAAASHRRGTVVASLVVTMVLGGVFLGIKAVEYLHKYHEGVIPDPGFRFPGPEAPHARIFFSLYFVMTGMHAVHMVIGIGGLAILLVRAVRGRLGNSVHVELFGLYWHFVDIVWIFLFPLLYLVGRH